MAITTQADFISSLGLDPTITQQNTPGGLLAGKLQPGHGEWSYWNTQNLSRDQSQFLQGNSFDKQNFRLTPEDAQQWQSDPALQQILAQEGGNVKWDPLYGSYIPVSAQNQWNKQFNNDGIWDTLGNLANNAPIAIGSAIIGGGLSGTFGSGGGVGAGSSGGVDFLSANPVVDSFAAPSLNLTTSIGAGTGVSPLLGGVDTAAAGATTGGGMFDSWFDDLIGIASNSTSPVSQVGGDLSWLDQYLGTTTTGIPSGSSSLLDRLMKQFDPTEKNGVKNLLDVGSGIYGLLQGNNLQDLAKTAMERGDPFGPYRKQYADQLSALMADPSSISKVPGYASGLQAVNRGLAAQGYLGSGNAMTALQKFGGDFYNQETARLAQLAGASIAPGGLQTGVSGYNAGADLISRGLASIGYGVGRA